MLAGLNSPADLLPEAPPRSGLRAALSGDVVFSTVWAVQSRFASIALFGLLAFASVCLTPGLLVTWSIAATPVHFVSPRPRAPSSTPLPGVRIRPGGLPPAALAKAVDGA